MFVCFTASSSDTESINVDSGTTSSEDEKVVQIPKTPARSTKRPSTAIARSSQKVTSEQHATRSGPNTEQTNSSENTAASEAGGSNESQDGNVSKNANLHGECIKHFCNMQYLNILYFVCSHIFNSIIIWSVK